VKLRADALLVARGLAPSRAQAQALIMAGHVTVGERRIDKPGALLPEDAALAVAARPRFVSRGGDKLESAIVALSVEVAGKVCLDVGASTGGFTDCLLQRGAARVYAVDVGYGQLADKLRRDARVDVRERVNARDLSAADFSPPPDLVVVDASFIGLGKLIGAIARVLPEGGELVALVKPQFEAGREAVSRGKGVIRDEEVRLEAVAEARAAVEAAGFLVLGEVDSAVHGPKGNVERFVHARRVGTPVKTDPA
jgi:23S rRNA (cytidine1920-2'-O)/16S rRNA (cytidine1409-2'-O)-methyltransferase